MSTHALEDGPRSAWPAKAAFLARMAALHLPVPPGFVMPLDPTRLEQAPVAAAARTLLAHGPVIARAALRGEDEADHSAAGLGESVGGVVDLDGLRAAVSRIAELRDAPWLRALRPARASADDHVIVQREISARWLVVAALLPDGADYVETHPGGSPALAAGTTPVHAGSIQRWDDPARQTVARLLARLRDVLEIGPFGLDVELVIDHQGTAWVVQARPIVTDVIGGWDAFEAELRRLGQRDRLEGVLVLDAEHNPAPLSPAHAWLMQWLSEARPAAGRPTVLAGWLYVQTLPRDLARHRRRADTTERSASSSSEPSTREVLLQLRDALLPEARRRLRSLDDRLATASSEQTAEALTEALDDFSWMIDRYLGVLVPARARAQRDTAPRIDPNAIDARHLSSTHGREAFADVLPAAWDIASPSLADLGWGGGPAPPATHLAIPTDPSDQATLLGEWDDHLFALGLAPVRRVYRRAGALLGLGDDVFLLDGDELRSALTGDLDLRTLPFTDRRDAQDRFGRLVPPLRIEDGRPVPTPPTARMRGIGIGRSVEGRVAKRRDLQHLLSEPPPPTAIVVIASLTAQAAVALRDLGVRAVCCAHGGALSHATLMARELGLSALVGCRGCLDVPDGAVARLDTRLGRLVVR